MMPTPCARSRAMTPNRSLDLALGQRRGRLVHDQDPRVGADRLGDLDELLLRHAQRLDQPVGIDRRADARRAAPRARPARSRQSTRRHAPAALERQRDVLGDGQVGEQRRLLVDRGDAERARRRRRHVRDRRRRRSRACRQSGCSAPVMILISVDLPAPFSPTSACTSPARRSNDTPLQRAHAGERLGDRGRVEQHGERLYRRHVRGAWGLAARRAECVVPGAWVLDVRRARVRRARVRRAMVPGRYGARVRSTRHQAPSHPAPGTLAPSTSSTRHQAPRTEHVVLSARRDPRTLNLRRSASARRARPGRR